MERQRRGREYGGGPVGAPVVRQDVRQARAEVGTLLDLSFIMRGDRTVIDRRLFAWPFVLTRSFHVDADRPGCLSVIIQTGSGAVHGEDCLTQRLQLGAGTAVRITNQGATSVHRADRAGRALETVRLEVAGGASLEYLPEPRIMFPDSALAQLVELECDDEACALIVDAFTMHDPSGEGRSFSELESTFCLKRSGDTLVLDRTRLYRPDPEIFRGYRAFGSAFLVLGPSHELTNLRALLSAALEKIEGLYAAASLLPNAAGLGVRLAAPDLRHVRAGFESIDAIYRRALLPNVNCPGASVSPPIAS